MITLHGITFRNSDIQSLNLDDVEDNQWMNILLERLSRIRASTGIDYVCPERNTDLLARLQLKGSHKVLDIFVINCDCGMNLLVEVALNKPCRLAVGDNSYERVGEVDSPFTSPRVSILTSFLYTVDDFYNSIVKLSSNLIKKYVLLCKFEPLCLYVSGHA